MFVGKCQIKGFKKQFPYIVKSSRGPDRTYLSQGLNIWHLFHKVRLVVKWHRGWATVKGHKARDLRCHLSSFQLGFRPKPDQRPYAVLLVEPKAIPLLMWAITAERMWNSLLYLQSFSVTIYSYLRGEVELTSTENKGIKKSKVI